MKILSMRLENYKSIKDSGLLDLNSRINIFAGKNNTGKTALIEALYYASNALLYDSLPSELNKANLEIEISVDDEELNFLNMNVYPEYTINGVKKIRINMSFINLDYSCINKVEVSYDEFYFPLFTNQSQDENGSYLFNNSNGGGTTFGGRPTAINNFFNLLKNRLVFVSGARYVPKEESTNIHSSLNIDGNNLNSFLFTLHNNDERAFDQIVDVFKKIFNDITSISTPINQGNTTSISLYFEGNPQPIPLSSCGSGFTHVLIILSVLFTKESRVVLYDEPHVFLHPSAEKAIYDLISETKSNQYFLTTHSPLLINYPFSKNIFLVQKEKGRSNYSQLDNIQEILSDIGLNNSDFALADRVIFVEGDTEEAVLPLILRHFGMRQIGYNYRILKMNGTGNEFSKKTAMARNKEKLDLVLGGISTSPIPYKILIDSDEKSDQKILEIKEKYRNNVVVLERREYENYFIDCYEELSITINASLGKDISAAADIERLIGDILSNTDDKKLFPREVTNPIKNAIGSEALERLFAYYDLKYHKVIDGTELTKLLLLKQPDKLEFLFNNLKDSSIPNEQLL